MAEQQRWAWRAAWSMLVVAILFGTAAAGGLAMLSYLWRFALHPVLAAEDGAPRRGRH